MKLHDSRLLNSEDRTRMNYTTSRMSLHLSCTVDSEPVTHKHTKLLPSDSRQQSTWHYCSVEQHHWWWL